MHNIAHILTTIVLTILTSSTLYAEGGYKFYRGDPEVAQKKAEIADKAHVAYTNTITKLSPSGDLAKKTQLLDEIEKRIAYDSRETGLRILQGVQYSTSGEINDEERLLEDGNYFLQIYYTEQLTDRFNISVSAMYGQSFFATNDNVQAANTNQFDNIIKADSIGLMIHPKFILNQHNAEHAYPYDIGGLKPGDRSYLYIRGDFGGIIAQSKDDDVDEIFHFESDTVIGFESLYGPRYIQAEIGYGYFERLPEDKWRSVARFAVGYYLLKPSSPLHGRMLLTTEFNGMEHDEGAEASVYLAYELDPEQVFKGLLGSF